MLKMFTWVIGAVLLVIASSSVIYAVDENITVTLIDVHGNRRIETATILAKIRTKEGDIFSPEQIREDVQSLFQLGHFEDVRVATEGFESGLKVIFEVKEKPLIREIGYEGNDELDEQQIKDVVTLLPRTAFNAQLLQENAEKIRMKYQDSGYYDAVVVPVVTELRGGDRKVIFYIEERDKIKLREIVFTGNNSIPSDDLKDPLKTREHWFFSFLGRSGTLRMNELKEDLEAIKNLYLNKGYLQVQVDEPSIEPRVITERTSLFSAETRTRVVPEELVVRINIREGEQFRIGSVNIKGNTTLSEGELIKEVKLKRGDVFSRDLLRQDVTRIMDRYDAIARPFANIVPLFNINQDTKNVDIDIEIQEGGEVKIGRIDITGNVKTRDKVIRREMRLDEGDIYSKKALRRSYERINNLNFFEAVEIVPERRDRDSTMDLDIKVKEKLTGTMSIGGGYSSVDKVVGIAEITQGNLGGRGQLLKFKTQWGGTRRMLMLSFMEPYLMDKPVSGRVDLYKQDQDYDSYTLETNGYSFGLGKTYSEYVSGSVRYSFDNSTIISSVTSSLPLLLQNQTNFYGETISTSALTFSLSRDSRDFYLDPKNGSRNSIVTEYAGGPLGGDPDFIKVVGDSAWYYPFYWDTVFMARGRIGFVRKLGELPVPLNEQFYVGGSGTLRGYRYGTVGPLDPVTGDRIGGNKELIFNLEYTFPIVEAARLKGLLFYDIGSGFEQGSEIQFSGLRHSYGWGFWWLSPIGPLRFEWGYIVNRKPQDQTNPFEFSIGTLF